MVVGVGVAFGGGREEGEIRLGGVEARQDAAMLNANFLEYKLKNQAKIMSRFH